LYDREGRCESNANAGLNWIYPILLLLRTQSSATSFAQERT